MTRRLCYSTDYCLLSTVSSPARLALAPSSSSSVSAAAVTAAAAAAVFTRTRLVDGQRAAAELPAVELFDGRGRALGRRHLDEAEAARAPGVAVFDHRGVLDLAGL